MQAQAAYNAEIDRLIADNPGLNNEEAIAAMEPVWEEVRQRFGEAVAHNPQFIRQVYESVGGEERWAPIPSRLSTSKRFGARRQTASATDAMPTVTLTYAGLFRLGPRSAATVDARRGLRPRCSRLRPKAVMELDNLGRNAATFELEEGHYVFAAEVDGTWRVCEAIAKRGSGDQMPRVSDPLLA